MPSSTPAKATRWFSSSSFIAEPLMTRLLLTLGSILALPSCLLMPHYETLTNKVSGCVVDANEHPISGATVDYHLRSGRKLGSTTSDSSGNFKFGPFRQWFYIVYIGSPGVCPVPYLLLDAREFPDALKVTHSGGTAVYCIGVFKTHKERILGNHEPDLDRLSEARWTGDRTPVVLMITPTMRDSLVPRRVFLPPPVPNHTKG
jgi:hypothetical protein